MKKDYAHKIDGTVVMDKALITRFLEKLERTFQEERPYKINQGVKRSDGTSMCQEITIAKTYIQNLADFCTSWPISFFMNDSEKIKNAIELIDKQWNIIVDELSKTEKIDKASVFNILERIRKELEWRKKNLKWERQFLL